MTLLDEQEDRLLAEARSAFTPDDAQARRVHAAVLASIAAAQAGPALSETLAGSGNAPSIAAGSGKLGSLVAGTSAKGWIAAAALAVGASSGAGIWAVSRSAPEPPAATARAGADSVPPASAAPAKPTTNTAAPEPTTSAAPRPPARERPSPSATATAPRARLGLREELAAVRDADHSLNSGDPARALAILDELARTSPGGKLREERAALRVLAECQLGTPHALVRAQRFLAAYQSSVYAGRVRDACRL